MLTEQQARDLLHLAAETVEVAPAGPSTTNARRRRWPMVAAAAAVVLVAGGVSVLARGGDPTPDPTPPGTPDDGVFRLGPDQVPSVFGYSADDAVTLLQDRGLEVTTKVVSTAPPVEPDCGEVPGRAVGTDPGPGTLVQPGDGVVLEVSGGNGPSTLFCIPEPMRDEAWALIDFAHGRGPAPAVADGVDLEPVLAKLREWSAEVSRFDVDKLAFTVPQLTTSSWVRRVCGEPIGHPIDSSVLTITIQVPEGPTDGVDFGACHTLQVWYFGGNIESTFVPKDLVSYPSVPADVVGNSVDDATSRLEAAGYLVEPIARADCQPVGLVTAQQPGPEYPPRTLDPGTTVYLAYTERPGPCVEDSYRVETPASLAVGPLVAFAEGGALPPVADTLDLYVGNALVGQLDREQAALRNLWPAPLLDVLASGPLIVTQPFLREDGPCYVVTSELPDELTTPRALSLSASFGDAEPETCAENWEAQLWLDDEGRLMALNVLRGDPAAN